MPFSAKFAAQCGVAEIAANLFAYLKMVKMIGPHRDRARG
jgi:hypothetical protein